jgi:Ku protein
MAAIWKGSLTFGLVNIPVELTTAVRADHISFRLLHEEDLSPVKYERVCQADGEPVPWNEIVKGYEYEKGKFVVLTDEDFKTAALEQSKTIDILDFVKQDEIDPRYFETPYYIVPAKGGEETETGGARGRDPRQRRSRPDVASARQSRGRQWKKRSSPRKEKVGGRRSQIREV